MGLSFFETMAGTLANDEGETHLIDMDLSCEATHLSALIRTGEVRLSGIIRVRPWAEDVPLDGTLRLSPIRDKSLEYDVRFRVEDGQEFRLYGKKELHWRRTLFGMTELNVELTRGAEKLAQGTLFFNLNDLPSFAASWSKGSSVGRIDLEGPPPRSAIPVASVLNPKQLKLLHAFGEAIIFPSEIIPVVDQQTVDLTNAMLANMAPHVLCFYRAGLKLLEGMAWVTHQKSFIELDLASRRKLVARIEDIAYALGAPIKVAHFSRREFQKAAGLPDYSARVQNENPRWMSQVVTPDHLETSSTIPCDVVIVGTGAGGAPLAAKLAEQGFAVALVEAGDYQRRAEFTGGPDQRVMKFWRDGAMNITMGNVPIVVPTGKLVGGSTAINSGTCLKTPVKVLNEWLEAGFPEDFEPENFEKWSQQVHSELQVADAKRPWLGAIADRVAAGAEILKAEGQDLHHGPLPRNAPGCDGQGLCPMGCPTAAKRSSDVSWVPRALQAGAYCFTGMTVQRILMRGKRAVAIEAHGQDRFGAPKTLRLKANAVVLSCGTLETPLLLKRNGFKLPRIGRGLSIHPALGAFAMFEESLGEPWRAIPQSYEVNGLVSERIQFEGFYAPPGIAAGSMPGGRELNRWMENLDHVGQYGLMVRDENQGRVLQGPNGRPLIRYSISDTTLDLFTRGSATLFELLLAGGANEVASGIKGVGTIRTREEARAVAKMRLKPSQFQPMGFHPLGTCAMGRSAEVGVVGFDHRVFGTQNLYVVDGSSVPTSLGANPQITIMSMALRAADILAERLSS